MCGFGICFLYLCCLCLPGQCLQLTILHTNDVHARIEETDKYSGDCTDPQGKCYGGMARLKSKIQELKSENPNNTILLDAGDQFQGTLWFNHYGGEISSVFMNKLGYDVMALGNHEFDRGVSGLAAFLKNVTFPVLSCNIDTSREPELQDLIKTHHIIKIGEDNVGIIGYTTKNTPIISNPGNVLFHDEIASIRNTVKTLQSQGVNKIIALGHSGFEVDKNIAAEIDGLDVIVGGHTNTFLYSGNAPSNERPEGPYPTVVSQDNGSRVLIVQDYAFGKYLGVLNVTFDAEGNITHYSGNPVLLNYNVTKDTTVENLTIFYGRGLENTKNKVVGRTLVKLVGEDNVCRLMECNLANLLADGMVYQNLRHADTVEATTVFAAIVNAGSIRDSIDPGNITYAKVLIAQPFRDTIERIKLQGKYLREALENSVSDYNIDAPSGRFLQFSGIQVVYDVKRPKGERVIDVKIRCSDCDVPEFLPLNDTKKYGLLLFNFLLRGGDEYYVIREHAEQAVVIGDLATDVFVEYIQDISPVYPGLEGRIRFVNSTAKPSATTSKPCEEVGSGNTAAANAFIVSIFLFIAILCFS